MPTREEAQSLQDQAFYSLLQSIINCDIAPGQKISLRSLEEQFGFGRTPLRESLVRLAQARIVYSVPQSGTYVSKINLTEAENARYVRECLETNIVVEVCARATNEDLERLANLLDQQTNADQTKDDNLSFKLDNDFHKELYAIAGRPDVWRGIDLMSTNLNRFRRVRLQVAGLDPVEAMRQHKKIYEAIAARDPDTASYLTHAHLHLMTQEKDEVTKAFPTYFEV